MLMRSSTLLFPTNVCHNSIIHECICTTKELYLKNVQMTFAIFLSVILVLYIYVYMYALFGQGNFSVRKMGAFCVKVTR